MKNITTALAMMSFSLFSYNAKAQNLVPNPSFEDTLSCPNNLDQVNRALGWSSYRQSPDYFNTCADTASLVSVPWNFSGYHLPRTGNGYSGFIIGPNYREFVGIELSQTLNIGQQYFVSFYACRGGNINRNRASNNIGIHLSTVPYSYSAPAPIDNISQVYTNMVITDTVNWTLIDGSFIADSAYQFLSIGNFFQDSLTTYISFDSIHVQCYYYLEDISLSSNPETKISFLNNVLNQINIFPNPTKDLIVIEGQNISSISIYNVFGQICFFNKVSNSSLYKINISNLNNGIFYLNIQTPQKIVTKKIILQKD